MLFAKIHAFNGNQQTIAVQSTRPDSSWKAFNVPEASWLRIENGVIVQGTPSINGPRDAKLGEINAKCEQLMAQVRAKYPDSEIMSWPKQEQEARSYAANPQSEHPLLGNLAASRGIPIGDLAVRIILKADEYAQISGSIIGTRQKLEDQLNAAETIEAINAVAWPVAQ